MKRYIPVLMLLLAAGATVQARTFTPVGATNGLDARVVVSLLVDSEGFLWVGSREGLFRYDGYETRAYLPESGNPDAISDIDIRFVYQDRSNGIWVGTNTGGLNRLDRSSGRFTHFRHDSSDPRSLADDSVYGISEGPEGRLWVATQKGLNRLDREGREFDHFTHDAGDLRSMPHDWSYRLYLSPSGVLWVCTIGGGLARWNPATADFSRFDLAALTQGPAERNDAFAIHQEGDGILWVGTRRGLVRFDPVSGEAEAIDLGLLDGEPPVITSIQPDGSGRIWLGTLLRGVLIVDTETGGWQAASDKSLGASDYLPAQPQTSLAFSNGQLFVGTWGSGVYRGSLEENVFELLSLGNVESLNNASIIAVMAGDEDAHPWIGSFGGGPQRATVVPPGVVPSPDDSARLARAGVWSMAKTGQGRLFAATDHGLYEFDGLASPLELFEHDPEDPSGIGSGYAWSLLPDGNSGLWVGMGGSGLHRLDTVNGVFTKFRHEADIPVSLSGDYITSLLHGREGYLWVGTRSNGLNRCRIDPWVCERFPGRGGGADGLSHFHVTALHRDRRGRLWVATDGGGMNQVLMDENTGEVTGFRRWTRNDGLLNDGVMAVQEDLDESLWLSTRHGLSRINPATGDVVNYVPAAGLPVAHFNTNASAADGRYIYFGSVDGLLSIEKGSLLTEREPAAVHITSVTYAAPGQAQREASLQDNRVALPYGDVVSIEMVTLDYSEATHEYAYRLSADQPWNALGSQRRVILHGLAPGEYAIQARGRDVYGLWGESNILHLDIVPPFWMTWWFRALAVLTVALIALLLFFDRERRLNRRAEELRRLSEKREQALEEQLGNEAELAVLTPRQKEILQLIAEGYSTMEIAELLGVSVKTIEAHRANLMERLEIRDVPGLVKLAIRTRLVSPHD